MNVRFFKKCVLFALAMGFLLPATGKGLKGELAKNLNDYVESFHEMGKKGIVKSSDALVVPSMLITETMNKILGANPGFVPTKDKREIIMEAYKEVIQKDKDNELIIGAALFEDTFSSSESELGKKLKGVGISVNPYKSYDPGYKGKFSEEIIKKLEELEGHVGSGASLVVLKSKEVAAPAIEESLEKFFEWYIDNYETTKFEPVKKKMLQILNANPGFVPTKDKREIIMGAYKGVIGKDKDNELIIGAALFEDTFSSSESELGKKLEGVGISVKPHKSYELKGKFSEEIIKKLEELEGHVGSGVALVVLKSKEVAASVKKEEVDFS